jgi:hypothetical protein
MADIINLIKNSLEALNQLFGGALGDALGKIDQGAGQVISLIVKASAGGVKAIQETGQTGLNAIAMLISDIVKTLGIEKDTLINILRVMQAQAGNMAQTIETLASSIQSSAADFSDRMAKVADAFGDKIAESLPELYKAIQVLIDEVSAEAGDLADTLSQFPEIFSTHVIGATKDATLELARLVSNLISAIECSTTNLVMRVNGMVSNIESSINSAIYRLDLAGDRFVKRTAAASNDLVTNMTTTTNSLNFAVDNYNLAVSKALQKIEVPGPFDLFRDYIILFGMIVGVFLLGSLFLYFSIILPARSVEAKIDRKTAKSVFVEN